MTVVDLPDDWVPILVAIIAMGSTVLGLIVAWLVRLGQRLRALEHRDRLSWLYIRSLINHAYRYSDTVANPLPEPPEGWLEET